VRALARVSVVSGDVSAGVERAGHGLDAEVGVAQRPVVRERG
jgi:hypothetical protein